MIHFKGKIFLNICQNKSIALKIDKTHAKIPDKMKVFTQKK